MKKLLSGFLVLALTTSVFGYTAEDIDRANYLAENDIIRDRSSEVAQYRLDDKISRQEVIAIAMKLSGQSPASDYTCRGYFSDAKFARNHVDTWVCAHVELAADLGVVSRENKKFRPKANITKAEALAMIMRAAGVVVTTGVTMGQNGEATSALYSTKIPAWQVDIIESAQANYVIDVYQNGTPEIDFSPNALATRAQVFEFAANILETFGAGEANRFRDNNNGTTTYTSVNSDFKITVPTRGFEIVSEEETNELGGQNAVLGYSVLFNEGVSRFLVSRYSCGGECDDPTLVQKFYQDFEQGIIDGGATFTRLGNNNYEVRYPDGYGGYVRVVMINDTVYIVYALVENEKWSSSKGALLEIVNSFKTL